MEQLQTLSLKVDSLSQTKAEVQQPVQTSETLLSPTVQKQDSPSVFEKPQKSEVPKPPLEKNSALDHYKSCPHCHEAINTEAKKELEPELGKKALDEYRKHIKEMKEPVLCKECGNVVERREPKCPNCGNTKASSL